MSTSMNASVLFLEKAIKSVWSISMLVQKPIYNNTCLQGEIATRHFLFHLLSHMQDLEYQALKVDYVK